MTFSLSWPQSTWPPSTWKDSTSQRPVVIALRKTNVIPLYLLHMYSTHYLLHMYLLPTHPLPTTHVPTTYPPTTYYTCTYYLPTYYLLHTTFRLQTLLCIVTLFYNLAYQSNALSLRTKGFCTDAIVLQTTSYEYH